jgi:hypothetical protein
MPELVANGFVLTGRDDAGRPGVMVSTNDDSSSSWVVAWRFSDDHQMRLFIIDLISTYLSGKMPDPVDVPREWLS